MNDGTEYEEREREEQRSKLKNRSGDLWMYDVRVGVDEAAVRIFSTCCFHLEFQNTVSPDNSYLA